MGECCKAVVQSLHPAAALRYRPDATTGPSGFPTKQAGTSNMLYIKYTEYMHPCGVPQCFHALSHFECARVRWVYRIQVMANRKYKFL